MMVNVNKYCLCKKVLKFAESILLCNDEFRIYNAY